MNLNQSIRLSELPTVNINRSRFDRSHKHTLTFDVGRLVPIYLQEVLPGSTIKLDTSCVVRLQTLIRPLMDNLYLDTYFFFVPNRIVLDSWEQVMGENKDSAWTPQVDHFVPVLRAPQGGFSLGSIADHFGLPINTDGIEVNALPFRGYAKIVDCYYRDENLQTPLVINTDEIDRNGVNSNSLYYDDQISGIQLGGAPFIAGKYHDVFSSCLPYPQKHDPITIPVSGILPVGPVDWRWTTQLSDWPSQDPSQHGAPINGVYGKVHWAKAGATGIDYQNPVSGNAVINSANSEIGVNGSVPSGTIKDIIPTNLGANGTGLSMTINDLRMSVAIQRLYERDAMYGSRYNEVLLGQFGVRSADARLQRPEFLGGDHIPINITQVVQSAPPTSAGSSVLGHVGAYSLTGNVHRDITQSFTEHGFIIGVAVCRYEHSFQQGIHKMWSRRDRLDYYWPVLAEISNQPVLNKEICAVGQNVDDEVFGYQEAWYDYRYGDYNHVSGEMRSGISNTLDSFHLADYYGQTPSLSADWIHEDITNVDRVLAVSSNVSNQILADFYFREEAVLPLPLYSIPSLSDSFIK